MTPLNILYSFPFRIGAGQICHTAWQQVAGLRAAGVSVHAVVGSVARPLPEGTQVSRTLEAGPLRVPLRIVGRSRACRIHDHRVASMLPRLKGSIDLVHAWPLASLETLRAARRLGIPSVLERPNSHTRHAFEVVERECARIGYKLPKQHEHRMNSATLKREEAEYETACGLLCPSEFVAESFRKFGFSEDVIIRHRYGYDPKRFRPGQQDARNGRGLRMIYAGGCAPRKGVHHALRAWIKSGAAEHGEFLLCGEFPEGFEESLKPMSNHSSVKILGHRNDMPELMAGCDLFVLPSVEEGSALTTYEARGSGCVLLVSDASGAVCEHDVNGLIHRAGEVDQLTQHLAELNLDRGRLWRLRQASLGDVADLTWEAAGEVLASRYQSLWDRAR